MYHWRFGMFCIHFTGLYFKLPGLNCKISDFSQSEEQPSDRYDDMLYNYVWKTQRKPWKKVERISPERCHEIHCSNSVNSTATTNFRKRLKEEGCPLRSGRWSEGEDDILVTNLQNYHKDNPKFNPILLLHSAKSNRKLMETVKETLFYSRIAEGLNRSMYDAHTRLKYCLFPDYVCKKGKYTLQETMHMKKLYQKHGPKWKTIGSRLGRSERAVGTQWHHLQATKFGHWDETEDYLLREAIKQYVDNTKCADKDLHNSLTMDNNSKSCSGTEWRTV